MGFKRRHDVKQATREALVRAGRELFAEQGLDGPSLDAICERAGYTRGAFYVHFRDRDDFLVAVMDSVGQPLLDTLLADAGEGDDRARGGGAAGDLARIAARFLRAFADGSYPLAPRGGLPPHQLIEACARSPRVRERYAGLVERAIAMLSRAVAAEQGRGQVRGDVDPDHVAGALLASVIGAQIMLELAIPLDLAGAAGSLLALLRPAAGSPVIAQQRIARDSL